MDVKNTKKPWIRIFYFHKAAYWCSEISAQNALQLSNLDLLFWTLILYIYKLHCQAELLERLKVM